MTLPAITTGIMGAAWVLATMSSGGMSPSGAYSISLSPLHLFTNLSTYLRWAASVGLPLRDWIASPDPAAIPSGILALGLLAGAWIPDTAHSGQVRTGVLWLLGFLVPVLPLLHHSYLYYLYLPWAGGALAVAGALASIAERFTPRVAYAAVAALVAGFVVAEAAGVRTREQATLAGIPADRTMRDAELLKNSISALAQERLPDGTTVGFVNPAPARHVSLSFGDQRFEAGGSVHTYYPLESIMEGGKTIRMFFPSWKYAGFSDTIPAGWDSVECFLFEQRGYLKRWGKGAEALRRQAEWLRDHRTATDQ